MDVSRSSVCSAYCKSSAESTQGRHAVEIFGGAREMSRSDDGGTEGPERGAGGAKRRSAQGSGVWGGAP